MTSFLTSLADAYLDKALPRRRRALRWIRKTSDPLGAVRLEALLRQLPARGPLHEDALTVLEAADAEDARAALEELAQRPNLANPTRELMELLRTLSRQGPFQDSAAELGPTEAASAAEAAAAAGLALRPVAVRLLVRTEPVHAAEALRVFRATGSQDRDPSAYLISLLSAPLRPSKTWVRESGDPLGHEGLKELLDQFPQLRETLQDDILSAIVSTDAADAKAALVQVAEAEAHPNPNRLLKGLLKSLNCDSPLVDTATPLGEEGLEEEMLSHPELRGELSPCAARLLARTDASHAKEMLDKFSASSDKKRNPSAFLVSMISGSASWARARQPLGAEGLERLLRRFPLQLDPSLQATLRLADAEDVKAVLEELAQRPDLENPTKMALGLLRSLSAKGPFQGVGRLFGRWRVARLLEQRPELIALGPCALRLLERTQAEHAKKCLELLGARWSTLDAPAAWFTSLLRRRLVKAKEASAEPRGRRLAAHGVRTSAAMSLAAELLAGGTAGAVGIMATQPMDTIRDLGIRLQSNSHTLGRLPYNGIVDCARSTLHAEGVRGLWKGFASPTFTVGGMNAVLFLSFEAASRALRDPSKEEQDLKHIFLAGSIAGTFSAFITGPTELVKCLAQTNLTNQGTVREEIEIMHRLVTKNGLLGAHGPLRGLGMTVLRDTPSNGIYFTVYEFISRNLGKSDMSSFVAGGCAGVCSWSSVYPIDVIKTRWTTAPPGTYGSLMHCLRTTVEQEGLGVLTRGYGATMARAFPQHAVVFATYELIKSTLKW
ncbi:unnamed protein product [Effrenium voratum]|nr:unnamed protein product [Effrenium voratum]